MIELKHILLPNMIQQWGWVTSSHNIKASSSFLTDRSKAVLFVDTLRNMCFLFVFVKLSGLFLATLWLDFHKTL